MQSALGSPGSRVSMPLAKRLYSLIHQDVSSWPCQALYHLSISGRNFVVGRRKIDLTPAATAQNILHLQWKSLRLVQRVLLLRITAETPVMCSCLSARRRSTVRRALTSGESCMQILQDISTPIPHQSGEQTQIRDLRNCPDRVFLFWN